MASIKDLKKRIGTVKNTQQTTRAMKMVSAAKLRRAQEAILNQRPYSKRILELMHELAASVPDTEKYPLMRSVRNPSLAGQTEVDSKGGLKNRCLLVVVSSDRGLCGGFNSSAIKMAQRWLKQNQDQYEWVELAFVGRKAYDYFKTRKVKVGTYYQELGGKVSFAKAKTLANSLVDRFLKEEVDEIKIIYSEFKNAVTQKVIVEDFLPLRKIPEGEVSVTEKAESSERGRDFIVKPSPAEVLGELMEKNFSIQAFRVMLESQAGEHGARMSAMENATKNAGEMIRKLTLQYNKQRQAGITKELLEIISGSESQKG